MKDRTCGTCTAPATNPKGPARCEACRAERVRRTQLRHRDKSRKSPRRSLDEPTCVWCGADNHPRAYEVLAPKRFCSTRCRNLSKDERLRVRTAIVRRCGCGASATNPTGRPYCDQCRIDVKRKQARTRNLRPYGMTIADYEQMLAEQNGRCVICGTVDPGHGHTAFVVDHCHDSGQVRGLLCRNCNSAIGLLQDSPHVIRAAAKYVQRTRQLRLI